jgi:hypothetical protein
MCPHPGWRYFRLSCVRLRERNEATSRLGGTTSTFRLGHSEPFARAVAGGPNSIPLPSPVQCRPRTMPKVPRQRSITSQPRDLGAYLSFSVVRPLVQSTSSDVIRLWIVGGIYNAFSSTAGDAGTLSIISANVALQKLGLTRDLGLPAALEYAFATRMRPRGRPSDKRPQRRTAPFNIWSEPLPRGRRLPTVGAPLAVNVIARPGRFPYRPT